MTTTEVSLRVYDLRCDDETTRRGSKTLGPRGGARCDAMRCDAMRCDAMRCDDGERTPRREDDDGMTDDGAPNAMIAGGWRAR